MKKFLLFLLAAFMSFSINAQIADGSVAPSFTGTDLNGNTHDLQTYLSQGKTVILNISATWCGPCWNYKQTEALSDIYYSYGPGGSDEVVVLYVEGDPSTGIAELNGSGNTVGDWVSTSPYPIIDDASIANAYQITYFPTIFRICPDGFVFELSQLSSSQIVSNLNSNCSGTLQGVDDFVTAKVSEVSVCEDGLSADFTFNLKNFGSNNVNSVSFDVMSGGNTYPFTENVNVSQFNEVSITKNVLLSVGNSNSIDFSTVNGNTPYDHPQFGSVPFDVALASQINSQNIEVHINTDFYPSEITWEIADDSGNVVANGGPYQAGTADQYGGGGPDALTTKVHNVTLPDTDACYTINLFDSFGDGWGQTSSSHNPGVEIFENGNSIYSRVVGDFGNVLNLPSSLRYNDSFSVIDFETFNFTMYPNPSNGIVNFSANENFNVELFNLEGKKVFEKQINLSEELNFSQLNRGIYLAKVTINGISKTEKLILN